MGIFSQATDDLKIDGIFSDIIAKTEIVLFQAFKDDYKNGLKEGIYPNIQMVLRKKEIDVNRIALDSPALLGKLTGVCVNLLTNPNTYASDESTGILRDIIHLLREIPGFNMGVIYKRAKRLDIEELKDSHSVNNLKI